MGIRKPLTGILEEFRLALEAEIIEVKKNASATAVPMTNGTKINSLPDEYTYRFRVDTSINTPSDSPVTVTFGQSKYDAVIVSFEDPYLIISSKKDMGDYVGYARLESDLSMLMEKLITRIEENSEVKNTLGEKMLNVNSYSGEPRKLLTEPKDELNKRQREAVESSIGRDLTYIWGPPGTGKTFSIGEIIEEFYRREKTVLLVSHTNTAVDGAIKKVCEELSNELHVFPILRLGQISSDKLREIYPEVTLKHQQKVLSEELVETMNFKTFERDEAKNQVLIAESIIVKCDTILNTVTTQKKMKEDLHTINLNIIETKKKLEENLSKLNQNIEKRRAIENDLATTSVEIKELLEKEKLVLKYNELLEEKKSIRKQYDQQKQLILKLDKEIQAAQKSFIVTTEKIIYSKKRENLEERKSQLFSPEKQKEIINGIEVNIQNKANDLDRILKNESELNMLLNKAKNSNFLVKAINKIPDPHKIINMKETVLNEINETNNQLASLQLLKENKVKEYREILSIYAELETFPEAIPSDELLIIGERIKGEISQLKSKITNENNNLELYQNAMINADIAFDEFVKTINFDVNQIINEIQNCKQMVEIKTSELQENDYVIYEIKKLQNSLQYQQENYEDRVNKLLDKFQKLDEIVAVLKEEILCSNIEEIKNKRIVADEKRQYFDECISILKKEIGEIQAKLSEIESIIIANAKIIGTTLTKAYLSDELHKRTFDAVILDEASMASIPALWATAYLASGCLVIVGDFKQLPPIALSNEDLAQKWIAKDIFSHSGVEKQCDKTYKGVKSDNVIILNEQFRMQKQIADLANHYYGILTSPIESPDKIDFKWYQGIGENSPINIIDTKQFHAWVTSVTKGGKSSRINYLSATLCVALAKKFVKELLGSQQKYNTKVLIVCPYRPHALRVQILIDQEGIGDLVRAGTIHSFQGSEADIVIFDLVVDEPHWRVGIFNPAYNESSERLFNVAITRAKHKLFFVGNIDYCLKKSNVNSELRRLLNVITSTKKIQHFDGKEIFPSLYPNTTKFVMGQMELPEERMCLTQELFYDYLYLDINNAKQRIIIYSAFITNDRLGEIIGYLQRAISYGVDIYVITKAPEERGKREAPRYEAAIKFLKSHNINVIYKKGMHEKLIFIDDDIIWSGSLNALSFSNTQEVMERRVNKIIFDDYIKLMHIEELIERMSGEENKCPICGDPMIIAEGKDQPFYYRCINDGCFTMSIGQKYPQNGKLTCEKCGGELSFSMIRQPRWICDNNKKHFMKVSKSHLRLPKMVDKIPKSELEAVESYFLE